MRSRFWFLWPRLMILVACLMVGTSDAARGVAPSSELMESETPVFTGTPVVARQNVVMEACPLDGAQKTTLGPGQPLSSKRRAPPHFLRACRRMFFREVRNGNLFGLLMVGFIFLWLLDWMSPTADPRFVQPGQTPFRTSGYSEPGSPSSSDTGA